MATTRVTFKVSRRIPSSSSSSSTTPTNDQQQHYHQFVLGGDATELGDYDITKTIPLTKTTETDDAYPDTEIWASKPVVLKRNTTVRYS
jgi:hypothetical protein